MTLPTPVTEIALLHLKSTPPSSSTLTLLREATSAQAKYSSYPVHLFTQVEDPSFIYLIGGWASARQHHEDWIPSPANQEFMRQLADEIEVVWMFHVEGDAARQAELLLGAAVVAVGRYFVGAARRDAFERVFGEVSGGLEGYTAPLPLFGGWRVEREEGEEFVLLSGWKEVQAHYDFASSEGFKEFSKIREYMDSAEINHMVRWEEGEKGGMSTLRD
ncbi:uncharacterized protein ACLA_083310 [Aspergillus clavatus NRRL 1]|uniref:ABM domain-containing protein n=1 Tax=Aspergillus clavatus (strain ATCC 1007 / CBS 513.65 / DSM 816 / NCTC 3887 / NRRL 1 / QM 1276 / 107) TaxID=344612 RepID=A1CTJ9_ASPCL|nr:uncharacterized protein ACLA_083310 [Aspergillus clavatus NRRL 1]EAW06636.1 conserved hypothetical protein [Aspergillus clavatus NRRL 1]